MNYSECFEGSFPIINVPGCCDTTASSNFYINDIIGLNTEVIAAFTDKERIRASTLIQDMEYRASDEVVDDLISGLREKLDISDYLGSTIYGNLAFNLDTDDVEALKFEIDCLSQYRYGTPKMFCLSFYSGTGTTATVVITDGAQTTTTTHDIIAGVNKLSLDYEIQTNTIEVEITFDVACPIKLGQTNTCGCVKYNDCYDYDMTMQKKVAGVYETISEGIQVEFITQFDTCAVVKLLKKKLYKAILYRLGILLLQSWKTSNRVNILAVEGTRKADTALAYLMGGEDPMTGHMNKGLYPEYMKGVIEGSYRTFARTVFTSLATTTVTKSF